MNKKKKGTVEENRWKELGRAAGKYLLQHRVFALVLFVQICVLFSGICKALTTECTVLDINLNYMSGDAQVETGEDYIRISSESNSGEKYILSDAFSVASGCYRVSVDYDALTDPAQAPSYKNAAGYVYIRTADNGGALIADSIELDDAAHHTEEYFWVRSGVRLENVSVGVKFQGSGYVVVRGIRVEECGLYRVTRLFIWLALSLFLDGMLVYFGRPTETLTEEKRRQRGNVLAIGGLTFFASLPCFAGFLYNGHDLSFHLQRIAEVAHELSYHQFPVRMMTEMVNGYGYANPLYYCDIFLYIPAILYNCLLPLRTCYQIYIVIVNLVTAWIAYYSFSRIAGERGSIGLAGACIYMLAAYRFTNLYIRAAVGEYTAMAFMPLAALGVYEIYREEKPTIRNWLPLSLGMSGVVLSHILSTELMAIFLVALGLICFRRTFRPDRLMAIGKAALMSLALTAWFLIPLLDMFLNYQVLVSQELNDIQGHGTYWVQLLGGMMTGVGNSKYGQTKGDGPFSLGLGLVLGLVLMVLVIWYEQIKDARKTIEIGALKVLLCLSVLALWFSTYSFPWDSFEQWFGETVARFFGRVQFPWRYLSVAGILITVGIVLALKVLEAEEQRKAQIIGVSLCAASLLVISDFYLGYMNGSDMTYKNSTSLIDTQRISGGEYVPDGTDLYYVNRINYAESTDANLNILDYHKESGKAFLSCENYADYPIQVYVPIFNYPNYEAVDKDTGGPIMLALGAANNHRLSADIPAGYSGTVVIQYRSPFLWRFSELISWLALLGLLCGAFRVKDKLKDWRSQLPSGAGS